ncbi:hypothetical protein HS088_TW12G00870 [Tripterygium wilfordii]|uniref:DEK-C domain-containing protein n=1 Tax=Tripterygium wilfordii TaxID=458696 RepID=A0A7J7CZZ3_TRIWF|nr:glutamic acid-rich protein-like [Tripterygium wilfordii]KAF5739661.1 hypothetical protein HS088_TW12G00870 [Tripterygium wilfordii]
MAEEGHDRAKKRVAGGDDLESRIKAAVRSRIAYFKEQADSLTLEGVRRLLEKDMGLDTRELDSHKGFIRQSLDECLAGGIDENDSKGTAVTAKKSAKEETAESPGGIKGSKDKKEPFSEEEEKMEDSPVMGLLTGSKTEKEKREETEVIDNKEGPNESTIKIAIRERVSYVKANSDKVTMAGFRRLLEEDLKLEKNALYPYKKLITEQLDEALNSYEDSGPADELKKKNIKNNSQRKVSKKGRSEESSDSLASENNEEDEDEVKPKRKIATKAKMHNSEGAKKRKRPEREVKESGKKRVKSEDNSDAEESGASVDSLSQSSAEKPTQRKDLSTPVYGKRVEHLKTVIKSCGMSIPPAVYKKVKQVPENKREAQLIKELEEILAREGLSSNPSEKEIKEVKKRKDRAKELEGIDMNNIVSSSRRRSNTTFVAPPKPPPVVTGGDESEDTDSNDDEDDDDSDDEGNDDEEENGGDDEDDEEVEDEEDDDSD